MLRDLREAGIRLLEDESGFLNLAKIEQAFLRTFHGDSAKMATFSEYVEASARWVISWVELGLAEVPAFLKGGIDQLIASFHKADGSINKKRLTLTIAGGILAAATLWAEWHKHKDDPGGFTGWLAEEGKEIVEGFFSPVGIGLLILGETPLGPALFVTLGAVAVYTAIHLILHEVVDATKPDAGETPNWLWTQLDALDKWLTTIENKVETWIERGIKDITDGIERLVSEILRDAFQFVGGEGAAIVSERNEIVVGDDVALIVGDERNNILIHRGAGEVYGDQGDDTLIGWLPQTIHSGDALERSIREGGQGGNGLTADHDYHLLLDGGEGKDWVIVIGGEEVTTIGGAGRDWIFNTSKDGKLYGDTVDGLTSPEDFTPIEDSKENSDNFWFWHDTEIEDAQHYDVLKFFGLPLTGGDAAASSVMLALGAVSGSLMIAGGTLAAANAAAIATGNKVYFDYLLPFMTYKRDGNDLLVANVFDGRFAAVTGQSGLFDTIPDGAGGQMNIRGVMRIKDFDFKSSMWGFSAFGLGNIIGQTGKPAGT